MGRSGQHDGIVAITMNQTPSRRRTWSVALIIAAGLFLFSLHVSAQETQPQNIDCRYWTKASPQGESAPGASKGGWFPEDDVFRPLFADPKQPQFFMSYQRMRFRDLNNSINAGFIGAGETFGVWSRRRDTCDGLQVSVQGGVF